MTFLQKSCHSGFSEGLSRPIRRTAVMFCKGQCTDESRCFDFGAEAPPLNMTDTEQSCIVNCAL